MSQKGLDYTFVHQGIRQDDLKILESLATQNEIDVEWLKNLLQAFHDKKTKNPEIDDRDISQLIKEHLSKL